MAAELTVQTQWKAGFSALHPLRGGRGVEAMTNVHAACGFRASAHAPADGSLAAQWAVWEELVPVDSCLSPP